MAFGFVSTISICAFYLPQFFNASLRLLSFPAFNLIDGVSPLFSLQWLGSYIAFFYYSIFPLYQCVSKLCTLYLFMVTSKIMTHIINLQKSKFFFKSFTFLPDKTRAQNILTPLTLPMHMLIVVWYFKSRLLSNLPNNDYYCFIPYLFKFVQAFTIIFTFYSFIHHRSSAWDHFPSTFYLQYTLLISFSEDLLVKNYLNVCVKMSLFYSHSFKNIFTEQRILS